MYNYTTGDGNDLITGFNELSTLKISGSYTTQKSGNDIIVTVGDDNITLSGVANLPTVYITNTETPDTPTVTLPSGTTLISGTSGSDTITVSQALGGRDYINTASNYYSNARYTNITIDAGEGNDTITTNGYYSSSYYPAETISINGGAGDDYG